MQKEYAALALASLAVIADNQKLIADAGGIAPLVVLAQTGSETQKQYAAHALASLAENYDNKKLIAKLRKRSKSPSGCATQ